jgi:CO/xanthine dehydrogenase Mo-binding subunit
MSEAQKSPFRVVGKEIIRSDAYDKICGRTRYIDDLTEEGLLHGFVFRSPVARGRLKKLTFDDAFDWSQVTVVTADDIPGSNTVDMMGHDMPFIVEDTIEYLGEPLALIAAPSLTLAKEAAAHIQAVIEELPSIQTINEVVDLFKSPERDTLRQLEYKNITRGNAAEVIANAATVIEGEFWTGHQEQLYLEPQGMMAQPDGNGGVYIRGSLQCPYYVAPELVETLDLPLEKIRVEQTMTGGAFGGKEDFPTQLAGYCALLALKAQRPVKIVYDRHEDMLYTTKRHPSWTHYTTALNEDGSIAAMHVEMILDGGAYTTLSPVVLYRGILHAALGYRCDNVTIDGYVYATNTFPSGAFRGFGAPQAYWGLETHIEDLAEAAGLPPDDFRMKNCLQKGDYTPTGQQLLTSVGTPAVLKEALKRSDFAAKLPTCSHGNPGEKKWYGIGLSFFGHGAGFTGDGESRFGSRAAMELGIMSNGQPGAIILASSTEMGQGAKTVLAQMGADGVSLPFEQVEYPLPDTSRVPNTGPTVASRTTMVVGNIIFNAGRLLKEKLEAAAAQHCFNGQEVTLDYGTFRAADGSEKPFAEVAALLLESGDPIHAEFQFVLPPHIKWDQDKFIGDAYPAYSWACNIAEVEVDPLTLEIKLKKVTAVFDVGRIINPVTAMGQLQGGLVQTIGYALMEKINVRNGIYDANRLQTYVIPTTLDNPEFDLHFLEDYPCDELNPGAKGLGEITMNGLAPAIGNAIRAATGVSFDSIPIMPEDLFEQLYASEENE